MLRYCSIFAIWVSFLFLFVSCEKGMDTIEYDSTVYLPMNGLSEQTILLGESIFELGVYKAGINQDHAGVTVKLKIDQEAFSEFRASNLEYQLLPETYYSIETPEVVIGKNSEREFYKIHLKGIDENFINKKYILPISIESVSPSVEIMESAKTVFLSFPRFRSIYECLYKVTGKVTPAAGGDPVKVDEQVSATSVSANTIMIKGAENNMKLLLTILENSVAVNAGTGSESYGIKNTDGKTSTYSGIFDPVVQTNRGTFKLFYSYMLNGLQMDAEVELKFWQ